MARINTTKTLSNDNYFANNDYNTDLQQQKMEVSPVVADQYEYALTEDIVLLNEKDVSRIQTSIYFDEKEDDWFIIDGSKEKESTNGTWLTIIYTTEIYNNMILEIFGERFILKEINQISKC